jgi:DNA-binding cell septation regulator SpoVG
MQIRAMNFKPFDRGSMKGFFDLGYGGLTIKGCRLMNGNNGWWFSFPQQKADENGEVKYHDFLFLTPPEKEDVRRLIVAHLLEEGFVSPEPKQEPQTQTPTSGPRQAQKAGKQRTFGNEDISEYYQQTADSDIPFLMGGLSGPKSVTTPL